MAEGNLFTGMCHSFCPQGMVWSERGCGQGVLSEGCGVVGAGVVWSEEWGVVRHPPKTLPPPPGCLVICNLQQTAKHYICTQLAIVIILFANLPKDI